jgi:hypothetical protein
MHIFYLSRSAIIRMRNVSEKIKTPVLCSVTFFLEIHAVYERMWKNIVETGRPQMAKWRMRMHAVQLKLQTHTQNM